MEWRKLVVVSSRIKHFGWQGTIKTPSYVLPSLQLQHDGILFFISTTTKSSHTLAFPVDFFLCICLFIVSKGLFGVRMKPPW